MAKCERLETCPFFTDRMAQMPSVSEMIKKSYCLEDKTKCARYHVSKAGIPVPSDLFPNDVERAKQLLIENRS